MLKFLLTKNKFSKKRMIEEALYEQVAKEMAEGVIREGLWAKAFSKSHGNEQHTSSIYIKLRVQSLVDEMKIIDEVQEHYCRNQEAIIKMPFVLSKIKSAIMRDDIEYIRGVDVYSREFKAHLRELSELAELSDASSIKLFFNSLNS